MHKPSSQAVSIQPSALQYQAFLCATARDVIMKHSFSKLSSIGVWRCQPISGRSGHRALYCLNIAQIEKS